MSAESVLFFDLFVEGEVAITDCFVVGVDEEEVECGLAVDSVFGLG